MGNKELVRINQSVEELYNLKGYVSVSTKLGNLISSNNLNETTLRGVALEKQAIQSEEKSKVTLDIIRYVLFG
jgi:hypothetical protein